METYTAIFVKCPDGYKRAPFDIIHFDDGARGIVAGGNDAAKVFSEIWKVDAMPFAGKTSFGGQ